LISSGIVRSKERRPDAQVGDRDAQLDGHERRGQRRVDVAGQDHEIGTLLFQHRLDALNHPRRLGGVACRA
jgi:hypothetical protein